MDGVIFVFKSTISAVFPMDQLVCACFAALNVQGNVIEKLPDYLMATYGIPKKYFLVKK
jgi:hypothetical protein